MNCAHAALNAASHASLNSMCRFVCTASISTGQSTAAPAACSDSNTLHVALSSPAEFPSDDSVERLLCMLNRCSPHPRSHHTLLTICGSQVRTFLDACESFVLPIEMHASSQQQLFSLGRTRAKARAQSSVNGSAGCATADASAGSAPFDLPQRINKKTADNYATRLFCTPRLTQLPSTCRYRLTSSRTPAAALFAGNHCP
jgi:hypothetical protein